MCRLLFKMSSYDDSILMMASDMAVGDKLQHQVCPKCRGGSSGERSFMVWMDDDGVAFKCYRVKCGFRGKIGGRHSGSGISEKQRRVVTQADALSACPLPDRVADWLLDRFPWCTRELLLIGQVQWEPRQERVLFPITGLSVRSGIGEGYLSRLYPEVQLRSHSVQPKAKAYHHPGVASPSELMVPPAVYLRDTMLVLEDYPSSLRLSANGFPSAALSGTSFGKATLDAILAYGIRNLVVILDSDATLKAAMLCKEYSILFNIQYIALYGADVKDMDDDEYNVLCETIRGMI